MKFYITVCYTITNCEISIYLLGRFQEIGKYFKTFIPVN